MRANRALRWVMTAGAVGGVLLVTTACGGQEVTFKPAANSSGIIQPADGSGAAPTTSADAGTSASASASLPPNIVVSTQGSSICVRDTNSGSQACVGRQGTAIVNGIVIVDGKVVSAAGSSGGGSVVINGNGNVVGGDVPPVPTSGQVTLTGAVRWTGSAKGTCQRNGTVRHATVDLANGGRLGIDAVGTGVLRLQLATGGDTYSGNWVGDSGFVSLADKSLTLNAARVGRGANTVQVSATLDC